MFTADYNVYLATAGLVGLVLYGIYWLSIPKPLPGIPYSKASIRPFGDIPMMLKTIKETGEASIFLQNRVNEMQTPVVQIFPVPFGKPWIVVGDSMIVEDILVHRGSEFDQSNIFSSIFRALVPDSMMILKTSDPAWKMHRRLMADTMSQKFLNNTAGPKLTAASEDLVKLWDGKIKLSMGRPFECSMELSDLLMESTWAITFGENPGLNKATTEFLSRIQSLPLSSENQDLPAVFPTAPLHDASTAIRSLIESSEIPTKSPFRSWAHSVALRLNSKLRNANAFKEKYIGDRLQDAWQRFSAGSTDIRSAADAVVEKEISLANREGRKAQYDSRAVRDELFTFIIGASDTTSTTMRWAMKFFTLHQDIQSKAREELRTAFGNDQTPNAAQVTNANLPYLEACIYEILRIGSTSNLITRDTTKDVELLGYRIPKDSSVALILTGPGYHSPRLVKPGEVKEPFTGTWAADELHLFKPDRWLVERDGVTKFDPRAGPMHSFGTGTRSCFGKRLGLLSLRINLAIILLNFEFTPIPEVLDSWRAMDLLTHGPETTYIRPRKI